MSGSVQQFKVYSNKEAKPPSSTIKISTAKSKCPTCCCKVVNVNVKLFFSAKTSYVIMSNNFQHTIAYENVDVPVDTTYYTKRNENLIDKSMKLLNKILVPLIFKVLILGYTRLKHTAFTRLKFCI